MDYGYFDIFDIREKAIENISEGKEVVILVSFMVIFILICLYERVVRVFFIVLKGSCVNEGFEV